jgi:hypothetical protein
VSPNSSVMRDVDFEIGRSGFAPFASSGVNMSSNGSAPCSGAGLAKRGVVVAGAVTSLCRTPHRDVRRFGDEQAW